MTTVQDSRREVLERRLWNYHGVTIADVLEIIDYLRQPGDCVIAGGSLAYGLGNRLSDFDIVICGRTATTSRVPLQHRVKSLRVDAWVRANSDIDRLFARAEEALDAGTPIHGVFGTVEEEQKLKLLHRVAFGLHVDGPPLEPSSSRDRLDIARDLLVREYTERMRESACVAQLAVVAERWLAAAVNARQAVEEALHMVLAARGVPFTGDKWLQERLKSQAPDLDELYQQYAVLPDTDCECVEFVAEAVALCCELTGLDLIFVTLIGNLSWAALTPIQVQQVDDDQLLLAPDIGGLWRLSAEEAVAWRGLAKAGVSTSERMTWRGDRCDCAEMNFCLRLYERGLVEIAWDGGVPLADLSIPEKVGL